MQERLWEIRVGPAEKELASIPDESVQCVVTSPPYWGGLKGLRDYGVDGQLGKEKSPDCLGWATGSKCHDCFVCRLTSILEQVRRVLRKDGVLFLNLGDSFASKTADGVKKKDLVGIPWRVALALQADGWYLRNSIIFAKPNPMPTSARDKFTPSHEHIFMLTKGEKYFFDQKAVQEPSKTGDLRRPYGSKGMWAVDGRPKEQQHGGKLRKQDGVGRNHYTGFNARYEHKPMRNKRDVWTMVPKPYKGAQKHYATFPRTLPETCILAGSRPGDIVLDPFTGTGTTGDVALGLGRRFIGIELSPEHAKVAEARLANPQPIKSKATPPRMAKLSWFEPTEVRP